MGNRAVLALVLLSCGSPPKPAAPEPPPIVKTYGPLGIRDDAKQPHQAVILGTDERNGSTILPLPAALAQRNVDAMFVTLGATPTGGMTPVKLSTGPNPDGAVQVGIYEEFAGGTGAQWRAGVWVSAFVAATALGKDLTDFTFSASSSGYIDGASASGLMAGGFLASMTGAEIDATATMTGIINPDGTIGPVAGIPEKFKGSIERGKKKLGYPVGMRYAKSDASGETVDLEKLAKDHGAEAIEISDVHGAYKLLTGKTLPEPVPVAETEMTLDAATTTALEAKYKEWEQRLAREWSNVVQLESAGRLPSTLLLIMRYAKQNADEAEALHKSGQLAAAYMRAISAWAYAAGAARTHEILTRVRAGDLDGAAAILDRSEYEQATAAAFKTIGATRASTLGGHLLMMASFQAALRSWGFGIYATEAVADGKKYLAGLKGTAASELGSTRTAEDVVTKLAPTVLYVHRTIAETELALQELEFEREDSVNYMCSLPNVMRLATSFQSASAAGLNYFDTLLVQPLAQAAHVSEDDARQLVALREPDYLVAYMSAKLGNAEGLMQDLKAAWGEKSLAWGMLSLAGSELAYGDAAHLVAKYYSLGREADDGGRMISLDSEKALANMLAIAERTARASARAARIATGSIPVQAKLSYQLAVAARRGDTADQVEALAGFWTASAFSQTAVMLARN